MKKRRWLVALAGVFVLAAAGLVLMGQQNPEQDIERDLAKLAKEAGFRRVPDGEVEVREGYGYQIVAAYDSDTVDQAELTEFWRRLGDAASRRGGWSVPPYGPPSTDSGTFHDTALFLKREDVAVQVRSRQWITGAEQGRTLLVVYRKVVPPWTRLLQRLGID